MKHYLFVFLCAFVALLVSCHRKDDFCPEPDGVRLFPEDYDYKEILKKRNIRFFNNPIFDEGDLDRVLYSFDRNFCRYPKDGDDYWHSSYALEKLNGFKASDGHLMYATAPKSYCAYMAYVWADARYSLEPCGFGGFVSMYFDRDDIVFYDCDSVIISSNTKKETYYAYKVEYLYDKYCKGELTWDDLREMGCLYSLCEWKLPNFYTQDSIEIGAIDFSSKKYEKWWKRYAAVRDSIVSANRLYEKTPLKECMLYYNRKERKIKEFFGKDIPEEITSNRTLKCFLSESFGFSEKASFLRIPFVIKADTVSANTKKSDFLI